MATTSAPRSARRHRVGQLAVGALSLVAGVYVSARQVRSVVTPPPPLNAHVEGPLAGLLTLYLPPSLWHVLTRVIAAAASAGLVVAAIGLLAASRRALRAGLLGLVPELALKMLLVPGRVAVIAYPGAVSLTIPGLDRPARQMLRQINAQVAAASIVLTMLYLLYLLWLKRELRGMRAQAADEGGAATAPPSAGLPSPPC